MSQNSKQEIPTISVVRAAAGMGVPAETVRGWNLSGADDGGIFVDALLDYCRDKAWQNTQPQWYPPQKFTQELIAMLPQAQQAEYNTSFTRLYKMQNALTGVINYEQSTTRGIT